MKKRLFFIVLSTGLLISLQVSAGEYHVDKKQENEVKFISDAPLENFEGVTDHIDGYIYWEGDDITNSSAVYFEVDLNTLDTGIGLRNRHMRENYLETERYPRTSFKGKIVSTKQGVKDTSLVNAEGKMFIHGVERPLAVEARLIPHGSGYRIVSRFYVKLSDYEIEIPSIMFYKIDENMDIRLDFYIKKVNGAE